MKTENSLFPTAASVLLLITVLGVGYLTIVQYNRGKKKCSCQDKAGDQAQTPAAPSVNTVTTSTPATDGQVASSTSQQTATEAVAMNFDGWNRRVTKFNFDGWNRAKLG